jgi:hypothetical protein
MKKIVHLVPYNGIGGVETAARSMIGVEDDDIDFQIEYVFEKCINDPAPFRSKRD